MENPIVRTLMILGALVLLYLLIKVFFLWGEVFFKKCISLLRSIFIIMGILILLCSYLYPEDTQYYYQIIKNKIIEYYQNNF